MRFNLPRGPILPPLVIYHMYKGVFLCVCVLGGSTYKDVQKTIMVDLTLEWLTWELISGVEELKIMLRHALSLSVYLDW